MPRPRYSLVSLDDTPYYHCMARCVRRAFLCGHDHFSGKSYEHRKRWVVERLQELNEAFAIDIAAYAVMANHYHVVVRIDADEAARWSEQQVAERWGRLFDLPLLVARYLSRCEMCDVERELAVERIELWRSRLMDLSWFMRCLNEHLARKANAEDGCSGRFWEGRFKSQALLGEAALLTCMAYVDLNPIRACVAETPEASDFTSIKARIHSHGEKIRAAPEADEPAAEQLAQVSLLAFRAEAQGTDAAPTIPFHYEDYLQLLDWSGRTVRADKRGAISAKAPPILERLGIDQAEYLNSMHRPRCGFVNAIGDTSALRALAERAERKFIKGIQRASRLFQPLPLT